MTKSEHSFAHLYASFKKLLKNDILIGYAIFLDSPTAVDKKMDAERYDTGAKKAVRDGAIMKRDYPFEFFNIDEVAVVFWSEPEAVRESLLRGLKIPSRENYDVNMIRKVLEAKRT